MLTDTKDGKITDWKSKKDKTLLLAESYERLSLDKKSFRVKECGTFLEFRRYHDESLKLNSANFCKVRLCPLCSWRWSLKIFGQVSKVMDYVKDNEDLDFLFLTLTARNCEGSDLSNMITQLMTAFKTLQRKKEYKRAILGYFRALEVTHNLDGRSNWYDTYHPHFHVVLVVNKSYFDDVKKYISQDTWVDLWKDCLKVEYNPIVHVTKIRDIKGQGISKAVAEVAKYTVKSDDYLFEDAEGNVLLEELARDMRDKSVMILDKSLARRRLTGWGGILKEVHQLLNLDDTEDGDLVNTDNDELREDLEYVIERYHWHIGYKNYIRIGE